MSHYSLHPTANVPIHKGPSRTKTLCLLSKRKGKENSRVTSVILSTTVGVEPTSTRILTLLLKKEKGAMRVLIKHERPWLEWDQSLGPLLSEQDNQSLYPFPSRTFPHRSSLEMARKILPQNTVFPPSTWRKQSSSPICWRRSNSWTTTSLARKLQPHHQG